MEFQGERLFERVVVIVLENQYRSYVLQDPYFANLALQGTMLVNSFGNMHPSQTNYISSIAGELCGVYYDTAIPAALPQRTLVDLLEEAGLSWRAYMESYRPGKTPWQPGLVPQDDFPYLLKHNPFSSFANIRNDAARWAKIGNETDFFCDVMNGTLPNFSWFTPNMWNDGHYLVGQSNYTPAATNAALITQASRWVRGLFERLRFPGPNSLLPPGTLVVLTFDEADYESYDPSFKSNSYYDGPNQIYTVLLGDGILAGAERYEAYNHYSLLRTIEKIFLLNDLGKNDAQSNWYRFLWQEKHEWTSVGGTELSSRDGLAVCYHRGHLHAATRNEHGAIELHTHRAYHWHKTVCFDGPNRGEFLLASLAGELILFYKNPNHDLIACKMDRPGPHGAMQIASQVGEIAITPLPSGQVMLAFTDPSGAIFTQESLPGTDASGASSITWSSPTPCNQRTSGGLALAIQGTCLHLMFVNHRQLYWLTRNTAEYNALPLSLVGTPNSATSLNQWSPTAFPVADFMSWPSPITPDEPEPITNQYCGKGPLAAASLEGVLYLLYRADDSNRIMFTSMGLSGLMTAQYPVDYHSDSGDVSNGFGTAAQAGWGHQYQLCHVAYEDFAICSDARKITLLVRDKKGQVDMANCATDHNLD